MFVFITSRTPLDQLTDHVAQVMRAGSPALYWGGEPGEYVVATAAGAREAGHEHRITTTTSDDVSTLVGTVGGRATAAIIARHFREVTSTVDAQEGHQRR